jgi:C4-dicarboxylate transporter, DctQ subunit
MNDDIEAAVSARAHDGDVPAPRGGVARGTALVAKVIGWLSNAGAVLSGVAIAVMLVYIGWGALGRYFHFWGPPDAPDVGAYLMAACFFLGLGYVFRSGGFIVMAPLQRFISARSRPWIEALLLLVTAVFIALLAWYASIYVLGSFETGTQTAGTVVFPLWAVQVAMPIGLIIWFLQVVSLLLERLILGRPAPSGELAAE